jgi:hypothetical protein
MDHGPKLDAIEYPSVFAQTLLTEKDRAGAVDPDRYGDQEHQRRQEGGQKDASREINDSFESRIYDGKLPPAAYRPPERSPGYGKKRGLSRGVFIKDT